MISVAGNDPKFGMFAPKLVGEANSFNAQVVSTFRALENLYNYDEEKLQPNTASNKTLTFKSDKIRAQSKTKNAYPYYSVHLLL